MIKQLLNLVIAKYHDLSVSHRSIIIWSARHRQITICYSTSSNNIVKYFACTWTYKQRDLIYLQLGWLLKEPRISHYIDRNNLYICTYMCMNYTDTILVPCRVNKTGQIPESHPFKGAIAAPCWTEPSWSKKVNKNDSLTLRDLRFIANFWSHRRPRRSISHWMNILIFTWTN